jgi:hypothetical protein
MKTSRSALPFGTAALVLGFLAAALPESACAQSGRKGSVTPTAKAAATPAKPAATPAPAPAEPAPAAAPEVGPPLSPEDLTALKEKVGSMVAIEGIPVRAAESKSKAVRFLDFAHGAGKAITVVFVSGKGEAVTLEEVQQYVGKNLRVTGKVTEYNGKPQIAIEQKSQIVEITPPAAP